MEENKKFKISDIIKNKQYYAIANLVFYFVLILVLIIALRTTGGNSNNENNKSQNNKDINIVSSIDGFNSIKGKNFNFKYTLKVDKNETIYIGKQYGDKIYFKDNKNNEYFIQENIVLAKKDNNFVLADNPLIYFNYLDIDKLEKVLSNTTKEDDELLIPVNTFAQIFGLDVSMKDGEIYIDITKKNGTITEIDFDLSEFDGLFNNTKKDAELKLEYLNFNLIDDFEVKK